MNNQEDQNFNAPPVSNPVTTAPDPALLEKPLSDSRFRFSGALNIARLGAFEWNLKTDDVFFDGRSREMFGFSADEPIKAEQVFAVIHAQDVDHVRASAMAAIASGSRLEIEYRVMLRSGAVRIIQSVNDPVAGKTGETERMIGVFKDLSDERRAQDTLRESEEKYRTLFNLMDEGFAVIKVIFDDQDRAVGWDHLEVNPAFEKLTGLAAREVTGEKNIRERLPNIEDSFAENFGRVALTGEAVRFVEAAKDLNRWFDIYAFRIGRPEEHKVALLFTNITERVQAEQEREKLLKSEQIARREAENSNRLKDEFLTTLSHELRTPLNAILGWTQILLKSTLDEAQQKNALLTIDRSARAQNQLIEDILDVSRIITGNMRLDVQAVNLLNIISAVIESAKPAAEAKNIKIQTLLDPETTGISGDANRLQQVVWNLLSNAIKFTPKGGRVQIRLERVNSSIVTTVSDTGKGIEAEFLPFVFDRFRQSDGSTTRRQGGLGLGLAIVRQLVELHGGTVDVSSAGEGQGSSFTMSLPVLPVRRETESETARVHPAAMNGEISITGIEPEELSGLRILIVDDEADSQEVLKVLLTAGSAEIETAGSASEALSIIERERFDIVISDIGMPDEDGYSLIEKIRRLPDDKGGKTPAIALTAYARSADRIKALRSGFQMHIAKPVEHSELIAIIVALSGRANSK